jgi:hypothetical protein
MTNETDSFISHKNKFRDMEKAKRFGMDSYKAELNDKVGILESLLSQYDDGRRKSFYCLSVNLLELPDIMAIKEQLDNYVSPEAPIKEKAAAAVRLFNETAGLRGISLKLRK